MSEDKSAPAENAEETNAEATARAEGPRWPLFYSQPVPLSVERHGDKSINLEKRFGFASNTNMVPVNMQEFTRIATSYPIVFTETAPASSIAILGLRQGQNL
ncbi:MAG: SapC family protein, partial [Pseudomonadota bacterium]|nr:SapC family protein [Pseudomonadota bacterium]